VLTIGLVLMLIGMVILAPESRADTVPVSTVAAYLDSNSVLPLAQGVDTSLASNLLEAQVLAWGSQWQTGSLMASEDAVLKAITLYMWPGGPSSITSDHGEFSIVWLQSNVAIDLNLSVGTSTGGLDFGTQAVPEPSTLILGLMGLVGLWAMEWVRLSGKRRTVNKMRASLQSYRPHDDVSILDFAIEHKVSK